MELETIPIQSNSADANVQLPPTQPSRDILLEAQIKVWKRALKIEVGVLVFINLCLLGSLLWDWNSSCDGSQLKMWSVVQIVVQSLLIFPNVLLQMNLQHFMRQAQTRKLDPVALLYMFSRVLNIFWICWGIVGIIWTFQAMQCSHSMPVVFATCFILAIVNIAVIGIPLLVCCLSIPGGIAVYYFYPRFFGLERIAKASPKLIQKMTKLVAYSEGSMPLEDACCAICLCEYQNGEEMRYLNCGHHFHGDCVTDWLMRNRVCPFCKADIEKGGGPLRHIVVQGVEELQPLHTLNSQLPS